MVAAAIAVGIGIALTAAPPTDIPAVALQSSAVYRVEVGAAVFFGLYVGTMAFALALQNRGFTEIGSGGIKARDLAAVSDDSVDEDLAMELLEELAEQVDGLREGRQDAH
ncbi:MAG: hypothetical protein JSS68_08675 [Actinobacteria bacterium]|nr:hypothetical protein [Actinomycetota bacterium]